MTFIDPSDSDLPEPISGSTENDLARRLAFLELGEADAERLRALAPVLGRSADDFVTAFYRHLFLFSETARFLQDPARVEKLKLTQREHLESMLEARWDEDYVRRRHKVGHVHAEVGIEPQYFLGAYNQYVQQCLRQLAAAETADIERFKDDVLTLFKAVFLDIGLTLDAYFSQSTQNLRHALNMYWKANAELKQFAQLTSHDLKTPLATIANLCDEAVDEFGEAMPPGARSLVEAARDRTFRISRLIDELLASAAVDGPEANEEVPSKEALAEALEIVRPLLEQSGVEVTVPASLPWVWGNKVRLRESLVNLLSNAAKFIDKRPGRVEIKAVVHEAHCEIIVADNGPGIPRDELQRVFVPFRRLAMHRHLPGSGLGLYFTRNLIAQQEGQIWADSTPGEGSRFHLKLKLALAPRED